MSDGEAPLASAAGARERPGRVREFLSSRSGTQRVGALLAVLILLTAPFGGLRSESEVVKPLTLGQRIDIGPFYVTVAKVTQLGDLAPAVTPDPGARLLVVRTTLTNHSDRAETVGLALESFSGTHTAAVPWPGQDEPTLRAFSVDDAVELTGGQYVNPGQSYDLALILQQGAGADLDALTLAVTGHYFREIDPGTLDPNSWVLDPSPLVAGHVAVEVKE